MFMLIINPSNTPFTRQWYIMCCYFWTAALKKKWYQPNEYKILFKWSFLILILDIKRENPKNRTYK